MQRTICFVSFFLLYDQTMLQPAGQVRNVTYKLSLIDLYLKLYLHITQRLLSAQLDLFHL
jgi:hypothetical protein